MKFQPFHVGKIGKGDPEEVALVIRLNWEHLLSPETKQKSLKERVVAYQVQIAITSEKFNHAVIRCIKIVPLLMPSPNKHTLVFYVFGDVAVTDRQITSMIEEFIL